MIIDIHAHTSTHQLWNLHTADATITAIEKFMADSGIQTTILMATYFPLKRTGLSNRELARRIDGNSKFRMFGSLDLTKGLTPQLQELAEMAAAHEICGIKLYPGYQLFQPGEERVFPVYELAREYGLPVAFHGGELHHCCPKSEREIGAFHCRNNHCLLDDLGELSRPKYIYVPAQRYPEINFVVAHLANPYFDELRTVMINCPNVFTDISGQFISGSEDSPEYLSEVIDEISKFLALPHGEDRLLFGTDFPIQSHAGSLQLVEGLNLTSEVKEKIYSQNALSIIKL